MALEHPRLLAASLTAAIVGTSCSTTSDAEPPRPEPGAPPTRDAPGPSSAGMQDPQARAIEQQRIQALVAKYVEVGNRLRLDGKLDAALHELLKARELAPENEQVRNLIAAVRAEQGAPVAGAIDFHSEQTRQRQIAEERARASVQQKLQEARLSIREESYAAAIETLRQADLIVTIRDQDWGDLPGEVKALLAEAERRLDEQNRAQQAAISAELTARLRQEYATEEARRRARVDSLLYEAQLAFTKRNFRYSQELATKAQEIEPNNLIALELAQAATKAQRDRSSEDYFNAKAREIRNLLEAREELMTPYTNVLTMDEATWERAQRRSRQFDRTVVLDPQDAALIELVKTTPVGRRSYTDETGDYNDIIRELRLITGVPIIITPGAREVISGESLKLEIELVNSISLENFLNIMVSRSANLAWTVRDHVVLFGNRSEASGTLVTEVHSVKDLVFKRTQFLPPRIRDIPGSDSGSDDSPRTGGEGDEQVSFIEIADLANNLKEATDPAYWEGDGPEIRVEDSGYLVVAASPEMQRRVASLLADMRRFATPVVTIDSKFLTITKNFLQEVGVDFRGLGGAGNKGTAATLDDVTNGLQNNASRGFDNGGVQDPAANPLSGIFYNDGGDGDVRGRTENYFTSGLGRALTPNGGLTASWTLINDLELNAILRAIEKREDAELVNSQILSVLDRERGHVAVINQTAYVRDFDVEVAQASFIADPKVDVIQDGIVLDVQPVIQHDRKYIILNLNPTVAELTRPIPTFTTSLGASTLPVTLQLPNLTVTSFATTAKVPDGGTVLLGGLRQILTKERRAEIPLLANLPLVSFFFKQEGVVDENRSLMVMVRAWITDIHDLQGK